MKRMMPFLSLAGFLLTQSGLAQSLRLETVWERNIFSDKLRPPLIGAVAEDGSLCLAMLHGDLAVLVDPEGGLKKEFRFEQNDLGRMVSIASLGFDPVSDQFWQWSRLARRLSVWTAQGAFVKSSSVLPDLANPQIFGERNLYVRRPDQASNPAVFSYSPDLDEEVLIWQTPVQSKLGAPLENALDFVTSRDYLLAAVDRNHLTLISLTKWEEEQVIPLPESWASISSPSVQTPNLQVASTTGRPLMKLLADHHNHFWLFAPHSSGVGVRYVRIDGAMGSTTHEGVLEDFPLMVDLQHFYFIDVNGPSEVIMRKVAFENSRKLKANPP